MENKNIKHLNSIDLRIGNYISDIWASENAAWQVKKFTDKKVWYGSFNCKIENAKPIKITEEWLLKFGFYLYYKSDIHIRYDLDKEGHFHVTIDPNNNNIIFRYSGHTIRQIMFIHELQNLYFAICGIELNCS